MEKEFERHDVCIFDTHTRVRARAQTSGASVWNPLRIYVVLTVVREEKSPFQMINTYS